MKLTNKTLTWLVAGMVSLALVTSSNAQTSKERTGKVVRIKGAARYSTGDKVWQPLKAGAILRSGTVVQTAEDSYVDIVLNEESGAATLATPRPAIVPTMTATGLTPGGKVGRRGAVPDQDVIRIQEDSILSIDKLTAMDTGADLVTETELDLRSGTIFGSVKKQAAASRFEVKVPNGVAGIRGTVFSISAGGLISCFRGSVVSAFNDAQNNVQTQVVPSRQQFNSRTGQMFPMQAALLAIFESFLNDSNYGGSQGGGFGGFGPVIREHVTDHNPHSYTPPSSPPPAE